MVSWVHKGGSSLRVVQKDVLVQGQGMSSCRKYWQFLRRIQVDSLLCESFNNSFCVFLAIPVEIAHGLFLSQPSIYLFNILLSLVSFAHYFESLC